MTERRQDLTPPVPQQHPQPQRSVSATSVQFKSESWQGPLPPPEALVRFNDAFPGCAERIVAMAENQSNHRQRLEDKVVSGNLALAGRAQILAALLAAGALGGSIYLLAHNMKAEGLATFATEVGTLLFVWWKGRAERDEDLKKRRGGG